MYIAILGRQPALGMGELESIYGADSTRWFSPSSAVIESDYFLLSRLGGTQKAGRVILELPRGDWRVASMKIVQHYLKTWANFDGKITLGLSAYGFDISPREVQKTGIILKQKLKEKNVSLRLVPNSEPALNTATSHHNKLGLSANKVELIIVRASNGRIIVAESIGAQNITAYTKRDQERPKRDAFVGMLPPKLAQIMINLATGESLAIKLEETPAALDRQGTGALARSRSEAVSSHFDSQVTSDFRQTNSSLCILDPFCGTGVLLQEAALMGYSVYGTDLSDKMIDYSQANLDWLGRTHNAKINARLHQGDAMTTQWNQPISAIACESYLGQPFSAPPSPEKLAQVQKNCDHIISSFLKNIGSQITPGTPFCIGVPAWQNANGDFTHLPFIKRVNSLGYSQKTFKNIKNHELLYYRDDQIVARELLVLTKS